MLLDYIRAALSQAKYKILEDGTFYGEIPGFPGLWANEDALEKCREELQSALEDWLLITLRLNQPVPVVGDLDLNARVIPAEQACGHTKGGRLIRTEEDMAKRKCPYPHDPDL